MELICTVGQLKKFLENVPDNVVIVRQTNGYYSDHKKDVVFGRLSSIDQTKIEDNAIKQIAVDCDTLLVT